MKRIAIGTLAMLAMTAATAANEKTEIAKCAAQAADAARLICYDTLAKNLGVDKPKTTSGKGAGKWQVSVEKSPIDDSTNVYMRVQAEAPVGTGYKRAHPSLFIRCMENNTSSFINWGMFLGTDETRVLTRLDSNAAAERNWSISTDRKAVFRPGDNVAWAQELMRYKKLLVQVTPYGESPVMATFDLTGLSEAIKPLREACHW